MTITRTNGFARYVGEGAHATAVEAGRRVRRYAGQVLVRTAEEGWFEDSADTGQVRRGGEGGTEATLAFSLGEARSASAPVVHGFVTRPPAPSWEADPPGGEYAMLWRGDGGETLGMRDPLGTRGLWTLKEGRLAGSVASDYRLLGDGAVLVPRSTVLNGREATAAARSSVPVAQTALSFREAAEALCDLLDKSVEERVRGYAKVAVAFSGGLDSSLLALLASRHADVLLCSAFAPGSRDERQASRGAALLGLELEAVPLGEEELARRADRAELPPGGAPTPMDRALWCIYSAASLAAGKRGARLILLGQLADELFGGYAKYAAAAAREGSESAAEMMAADVAGCAERGFLRDEAACSASCEVRFPYADARVAELASVLPLAYKIRDGERKAVLRAAAAEAGLPEELVSAPKKAAQYSSGAARLLRR